MSLQDSERDLIDKILYCKNDPSNVHILNEPMLLPCNHSICKSCADENKKKFSCNYCFKEHSILNKSLQLKPNLNFIDFIKSNLNEITSLIVKKLKDCNSSISGKLLNASRITY